MYAKRKPDLGLTGGKHGCWLFVVQAGAYTPVAAFSHGFSSTEQVCPHQVASRMVIPVGFTFNVLIGCRCTVRNPILKSNGVFLRSDYKMMLTSSVCACAPIPRRYSS